MPFVPSTFNAILKRGVNFVQNTTDVTDFNIAGVVRTILEAQALEADEQYFQMLLLKSSFSLQSAVGKDLDTRVAEFGIYRLAAASSAGFIQVTDTQAVTSELVLMSDGDPGETSFELSSTADFPTTPVDPPTGPNFKILIGEGTENEEILEVIDNDTTLNVLTVLGTYPVQITKLHTAGETVTLIPVTGAKTIVRGLSIRAPATATRPAIDFVTTEEGLIGAGRKTSGYIPAVAVSTGTVTNIGVGQITQFASSPPFVGASVSNLTGFSSGRDAEIDDALRQRARDLIQSLANCTVRALSSKVQGIEDPDTRQRVVSARVREDFANNEVQLYIDDGTGNVAAGHQNSMPVTVLTTPTLSIGSSTLTMLNVTNFPPSGAILIDANDPAKAEVVSYSSIDSATNTLNLVFPYNTKVHTGGALGASINLVDVIVSSAELRQKYFRTQLFPLQKATLFVYANRVGGQFTRQVEGTDYEVNIGNGEIAFLGNGLESGVMVVAFYSYYSGLLRTVQRFVDGDSINPDLYPGIRAGGVRLRTLPSSARNISVSVSIAAQAGYKEQDLIGVVKQTIEDYINSRKIGEDVILSEIVQRVQGITIGGVEPILDTVIISPTSNVVILENELPRTSANYITVT